MNKKTIGLLTAVIALLIAGIVYLGYSLNQEKQANQDMMELAALEKTDMENEYQQFADQYSEMKTRINNDSIVAQLTKEQERTQQLLEEDRVRSELEQSNQHNQELASSNMSLSQKVAIASQLNATNIAMTPLTKKGKNHKKLKGAKTLSVTFVISRNVTAANGTRDVYVRVTTPQGEVLNGGGTFAYENRQLAYSMKKTIEYTGEETAVSLVWPITETLTGGSYNVSVFADDNMIGSKNFTFEK